MIELLFIELGAVVTEILGSTRCTIEPFCDPAAPPTYDPGRRFEVDFTKSLDHVLSTTPLEGLTDRALYDQIVAPDAPRRVAIGPSWPGGGTEGILSIREDLVGANTLLAAAADSLAGPRCKYQIVVSIDDDKTVRRYHGFHAEVIRTEGAAIIVKLVGRDGEIKYDPGDSKAAAELYAGGLVADNVLRAGAAPGTTGALFMTETAYAAQPAFSTLTGMEDDLPKLPPSAGL